MKEELTPEELELVRAYRKAAEARARREAAESLRDRAQRDVERAFDEETKARRVVERVTSGRKAPDV